MLPDLYKADTNAIKPVLRILSDPVSMEMALQTPVYTSAALILSAAFMILLLNCNLTFI